MSVKVKDNGYLARVKAIAQLSAGNYQIHVGVQGQKAQASHGSLTVGELAAIHEFGLGVPERSFLRAWFDANQPKIENDMRAATRQILLGRLTPDKASELLGMRWVGQIQTFIADGKVEPALSPSTVKSKGSSVPLIDTGQLRSAITYLVRNRFGG